MNAFILIIMSCFISTACPDGITGCHVAHHTLVVDIAEITHCQDKAFALAYKNLYDMKHGSVADYKLFKLNGSEMTLVEESHAVADSLLERSFAPLEGVDRVPQQILNETSPKAVFEAGVTFN